MVKGQSELHRGAFSLELVSGASIASIPPSIMHAEGRIYRFFAGTITSQGDQLVFKVHQYTFVFATRLVKCLRDEDEVVIWSQTRS